MKLRRGFAIPTAAVFASAAVLAAAPIAAAETSPAPTATAGATAAPTATATASTTAAPTVTPTASSSATATATATTKPSPTSTTPSNNLVLPKVSLNGFPSNIVPGAPAVEFSADFANVSGHDGAVFPYLIIASKPKDLTDSQVKLQFLDPDTKTWKDAVPEPEATDARVLYLDKSWFYLKKDEKLTFQFKLALAADAPANQPGAAALAAVYRQEGNPNIDFPTSPISEFTIGKAGTNAGGSTPINLPSTKGKADSNGDTVAKAKAKAGSRASNLAETGGGSNTTAIALTGAGVVALGAGTLVFLRRRKAGTSA